MPPGDRCRHRTEPDAVRRARRPPPAPEAHSEEDQLVSSVPEWARGRRRALALRHGHRRQGRQQVSGLMKTDGLRREVGPEGRLFMGPLCVPALFAALCEARVWRYGDFESEKCCYWTAPKCMSK